MHSSSVIALVAVAIAAPAFAAPLPSTDDSGAVLIDTIGGNGDMLPRPLAGIHSFRKR